MRILIIDRPSMACQSRKARLNTWYQSSAARGAANVCEALHLLEEFQPDFILADVRVADSNGLKAIHLIKTEYQSFLVIVLTLDLSLKAKALSAGADAFIIKNDVLETLWGAFTKRQCELELKARQLVRLQNEKDAYTLRRSV